MSHRALPEEALAGVLFIEKSVFTKRTQLKNTHLPVHEIVRKNTSWVRYTKNTPKMGEKVPKYRSGRVVLGTNEAKRRQESEFRRQKTRDSSEKDSGVAWRGKYRSRGLLRAVRRRFDGTAF